MEAQKDNTTQEGAGELLRRQNDDPPLRSAHSDIKQLSCFRIVWKLLCIAMAKHDVVVFLPFHFMDSAHRPPMLRKSAAPLSAGVIKSDERITLVGTQCAKHVQAVWLLDANGIRWLAPNFVYNAAPRF